MTNPLHQNALAGGTPIAAKRGRMAASDLAGTIARYALERDLHETALLGAMLEHIPDGLVLTNAASEILWANEAYCAMTGYSLSELVGRTPRLTRSSRTQASQIEALWEGLDVAGRAEARIVDRRADGTEFHALLTIVRIDLARSSGAHYLGVLRDNSLEVAHESRLRLSALQSEAARDITILAMATMAEQRDGSTGRHLQRVEGYCEAMTAWILRTAPGALPAAARDAKLVARCAMLHDIGKVGIPDQILCKTGRLDAVEQEAMRRHPIIGAEILDRVLRGQPDDTFLHLARDVVLYHHEAYDGSGYPFGLAGDAIPLVAQLTSVADVFDALTSERPYKAAHSFEDSFAWIAQRSASLFSPLVVDAFEAVANEIREIHRALADSGNMTDVPISTRRLDGDISAIPPVIRPSLTELRHGEDDETVAGGDGVHAVLSAVLDSGLTGEVRVQRGERTMRVEIAEGNVLWIEGTGASTSLSRRLVDERLIQPGMLERAVAECKRTGNVLSRVLLQWEAIEPSQLRGVIRRHLSEKLEVLFTPSGDEVATFVSRPRVRTAFGFELEELQS